MLAQRDHMGLGAMARCPPCWMLEVDGIHQSHIISSDPKETKTRRKRMRKGNYVGMEIRVSVTVGI